MKMTRWAACAMWVLAGVGYLCSSAGADVYLPKGNAPSGVPTIKSSEDAVASIPILSRIPRSFIIGDGFRFKLSGLELRIDHMGTHSNAPANKRNCLIGFSYATPVSFFGSRIELPLFHAENLKLSDWGFNTPGDYVVHLSKDASVENPTLGLSATVRF